MAKKPTAKQKAIIDLLIEIDSHRNLDQVLTGSRAIALIKKAKHKDLSYYSEMYIENSMILKEIFEELEKEVEPFRSKTSMEMDEETGKIKVMHNGKVIGRQG